METEAPPTLDDMDAALDDASAAVALIDRLMSGIQEGRWEVVMAQALDQRIQAYADQKFKGDWKQAHDYLIDFALRVIEGRRKGGSTVGNRPQQEKHLARARKIRAK